MERFWRFIGTILLVVYGFIIGLELIIAELIACVISIVTIIPIFLGIPKIHLVNAKNVIFPFGMTIKTDFFADPVRNIVSFIFGGFITGVFTIACGIIYCITIIFIPLGLVMFDMSKISFAPFGASFMERS